MSDTIIELTASPDLVIELVFVQGSGGAESQPAVLYTAQNLSTEQKARARENTDSASNQDFTNEASTRQQADQTLQTDIDNEASTRQQADQTLQTNIDNEASTRQTVDSSIQAALETEVADRATADEALSGRITDETNARAAADNTLQTNIDAARSIAEGRSKARVFDTVDAMNAWLAIPANASTLNIGDNLLIRATDVPDYWWDGTTAQKLETQKIDLSSYVQNTRKINGQDLTADVNLTANDISETSGRGWLTTALKAAYDSAVNWISTNGSNLLAHLTNTNNPHSVTKVQINLGNVPNTDCSTTDNISEGTKKFYTDARARAAINNTVPTLTYNQSTGVLSQNAGYYVPSTADQTNWNSKQAALGYTPENMSMKGVANGYAPLGFGAVIPMVHIPTYILEALYAYGATAIDTGGVYAFSSTGNASMRATLPIQSKMRGCLLDDAGNVSMYLPSLSWSDASLLDGSKGQVMVEIPEHYYKSSRQGNNISRMISELPLPGYKHAPKRYISAYEASTQRSTGKLCSVMNTSADYRGGDNTSAWDGSYRTLIGTPVTNMSRTAFRNAARLRGASFDNPTGWNCLDYSLYKDVCWLFYIEYATFNSQLPVSAKDANGFATGGLGNGITTMADWGAYNNYNPVVPCGATNLLGNGSGESSFTNGVVNLTPNRYRGIENPFGHIWKWVDGVNIKVASCIASAYVSKTPESYSDSGIDGYELRGSLPNSSGYMVSPIYMTPDNNEGDILPNTVGGSSSTYFCDYYYADNSWDGIHGLLVGGPAGNGVDAGLACSDSSVAPSSAYAGIGSRLCFIP